jgi:DNA-binding XRE family transcriptional regulator
MPGRKRTEEEIAEREGLALEFKTFRRDFKFSQKKLADTLEHGACRRTIQMIEAGKVNPNPDTLKRFRELMRKHKANKGR